MYASAPNLNLTAAHRMGMSSPDYGSSWDRMAQGRREFVRQTALFGYYDRREFLNDVHRFHLAGKQFRLLLLDLEEPRRPAGFHQFSVRAQLCRTLDRSLYGQYCLADEQLGRYILLVFSRKSEPLSEPLLRQALAACCEENRLPFQISASPVFQVFEDITGAYSDARHPSEARETSPAGGPQMAATEQILAYLQENYRNNITLTEISALVHMNASYVSRLLPERTGRTFSQHLLDIRIGRAKDLLLHTSLKSREIAERVGFENAKYFSHVFTKAVGIPPMQYRCRAGEPCMRQ